MANITESKIIDAMKTVMDPELHKDLVTLGMIKDVKISGTDVELTVVLTTPACPLKGKIEADVRAAIAKQVPEATNLKVNMSSNVMGRKEALQENLAPTIKNIIAVSSGKGGVGKSTVAVNLALALAETGANVGIMDADIYGPSVPLMLDIAKPKITGNDKNKMYPPENYGLKVMSIGFFVKDGDPVMWRGPMLHSAIRQFLGDTLWGDLDYLIVDLPPGTGDAQMSLTQCVTVTGVVGVTTPQDVALLDSDKGLAMFTKLKVPVLGIVENMSFFDCPHCHHHSEIFSHGGGEKTAAKFNAPLLGKLPLNPIVREGGDAGKPVFVSHPESTEANIFREIAAKLAAQASIANANDGRSKPPINVSFGGVTN